MKTAFRRLVRIKAKDGSIKYGEGGEQVAVGDTVEVYNGTDPWELQASGEKAEIAEVNEQKHTFHAPREAKRSARSCVRCRKPMSSMASD